MKKIVLPLLVVALFAATPTLAAEFKHSTMSLDECIKHCALQNETIEQRIDRLQKEIAAGKSTYSVEELRKLETKLQDANFMLDAMNRP